MGDLFRTAGAAVGVFAGTNVDDLIVLTVLFLTARASGRPRPAQIWAGQYGGIGVLIMVSIVAALGLALVPDRWVPLLGLVPIALGVRGLVGALRRRPDDDGSTVAGQAPVVPLVFISIGAVILSGLR